MVTIHFVLALAVVACLIAIAVLHVYWAAGGVWPGRTQAELASIVVGSKPGVPMPGPLLTSIVALLLILAALLVAGVGLFGQTAWPWRLGSFGVAAVLGLRGGAGYFEARTRPEIRGQPYESLNRRVYSPLCLALATAIVVALLR